MSNPEASRQSTKPSDQTLVVAPKLPEELKDTVSLTTLDLAIEEERPGRRT